MEHWDESFMLFQCLYTMRNAISWLLSLPRTHFTLQQLSLNRKHIQTHPTRILKCSVVNLRNHEKYKLTFLLNISCMLYILSKVELTNDRGIWWWEGGCQVPLVCGQWLYHTGSRTSSRYCCQQPSSGPLPQCWKLIFPVQHLVSNTSSPLNLKYENEDYLPQLLLRAGDQGKWAAREYMKGQKKKKNSPWLKLLYYNRSIFSIIVRVHNHYFKIWEGKD